MTVTTSVTLPAQPAAGSVSFLPLGGNGWLAPQSMFMVDIQLTGDVSGGVSQLDIFRDERFEMLIDFMMVQSDAAAVIEYRFDIFRQVQNRVMNCGSTVEDPVDAQSVRIFSPPAVIDPDSLRVSVANVDGDVTKFKAMIYNFNIRASERVPLDILLASVRKSSSVT